MSFDACKQSLKKLVVRDELFELLIKSNYEQICKSYKQICFKLVYLLKCLRLVRQQLAFLEPLNECFNLVKALIQASEYTKYGHRFPLLELLVQKYQLFRCENIQKKNHQKINKQMLVSQLSEHCQILSCPPISAQEVSFYKSGRVEQFFQNLNNHDQILNNPSCVCCSRVFIYKSIIENKNPIIQTVKEVAPRKVFDKMLIQKTINAVCNQGGGVILIGAKRKSGFLRASGVKYKNQQQIIYMEKQIANSIQLVQPSCKCYIQRVLIHVNFEESDEEMLEYMRFCLRILVIPNNINKLSYLEVMKKGGETIYQIYKFQASADPVQVPFSRIYKQIHEGYQKFLKRPRSSHQNINCCRPYYEYSKRFYQFYKKNVSIFQELTKEEGFEQISSEDQIFSDDPVLKYQNASLVIVGSNNQEHYIRGFAKYLSENKETFKITKLYSSSFPECTRSVWLLSHEKIHPKIKNHLNNYSQRLHIKTEAITAMPVYSCLSVLASKYTNYVDETLVHKMTSRFKVLQGFEKKYHQIYDSRKGQVKSAFYLNFKNLQQSMYAYMIFETMQIKPYFYESINNLA